MSIKTNLSADQVAWILDVFERNLPPSVHPRVSRTRDMAKYTMLYEVMEVAGLVFADDAARSNGTPPDARSPVECFNRVLSNKPIGGVAQ